METRWIPVCKWCQRTTGRATVSFNENPPTSTPHVSGKCPVHPSKDKDANHECRWERTLGIPGLM